jgi:sec-independent protein translocase protein TatB
MFEFGFWELVLVLVMMLVVAGPERLPGIVRTLGRWAGRAKALAGRLRDEFEREVQVEELRAAARDAERAGRELDAELRGAPPPTGREPRDG